MSSAYSVISSQQSLVSCPHDAVLRWPVKLGSWPLCKGGLYSPPLILPRLGERKLVRWWGGLLAENISRILSWRLSMFALDGGSWAYWGTSLAEPTFSFLNVSHAHSFQYVLAGKGTLRRRWADSFIWGLLWEEDCVLLKVNCRGPTPLVAANIEEPASQ